MPPGRTWQEKGPRQQRHGPYTHIQPAPKKVKPQQERQRFKVQALSQLDAIANEGLRAVEAELTTMAWARNQLIWLRLDQPHSTRMHCEIVDNHGEPLLMSNQELYSVMVQINWTLKTQALVNMQVQWRPKSAGKWHPFQWEAILDMYHGCPAQNIERETNIVRLPVAILGNLYRRACDMLRSVAWKFSKTLGKMLGSFGSQIGPPKRNRYR